jgi:hypothetical protein
MTGQLNYSLMALVMYFEVHIYLGNMNVELNMMKVECANVEELQVVHMLGMT